MAKVTFHIFTLFPEWFETPLKVSIIGRAIKEGHIAVFCHNIRDYATDKHRTVDDYPYGGGAGLVLKPEPIFAAVESVLEKLALPKSRLSSYCAHKVVPSRKKLPTNWLSIPCFF
jgi:tRNA (guanine37-N1)-methyltransferase